MLYDNFIHTCGLINRPLSINGFTEVRHQVVSSRKKLNYALHYIKIGEHLNKITSNFTLQIPLGIIFKNENVNEDIISILQQFHSYLPKAADGRVDGQLFSGDQLTVERAVNAISSVANGDTPADRLEGIHLQLGDWHATVKLLSVCIRMNYNFNLHKGS